MKKGVLKNFLNFWEKHLCRSLFLMKLLTKNDIITSTYFVEHRLTAVSKGPYINNAHKYGGGVF